MVTKATEDKQFCHQMITFSEEKKSSSSNIIKILKIGDEINILSPKMYKLVTKKVFVTYCLQIIKDGHGQGMPICTRPN